MMWTGMGLPMLFLTLTSGMLVLALLAGAVYLIGKAPRGSGLPARVPAEELLAERYARGEIDDKEYRQRLATLHTP